MRGKYDGPKINDYDKFCESCFVTFAFVALRSGAVFDDDNSCCEMAADDGNYCGMLIDDGDECKQI